MKPHNGTRLVVIGIYASDVEANIAKGVLDTNGIPAIIDNEIFSSVLPVTLTSVGGLRLLVRDKDESLARQLLE
ncbi:MAG: DUF2007 domain-containing protein [Muribaculaceae bacterium]|nr:DUF2007 domain-containing protein [Muribaculaceae bacterium]